MVELDDKDFGQMLHAKEIGFIHPVTNEYMEFEAPLPSDFEAVLHKWRNYLVQPQ